MAQVIVELTGEEKSILDAYRKAESADKKLRDSAKQTGKAGDAASKEFAKGWIEGGKKSSASIDKMIRELKRTGPEGISAAKAIEKQMIQAGSHGRKSIKTIIDQIGRIDDAAAAAGQQASAQFDKMNTPVEQLGDKGEAAGQSIIASMTNASGQSVGQIGKISESVGVIDSRILTMATAGGAVGLLGSAFQAVGDAIEANNESLKRSHTLAIGIAAEQQSAVANMVGVDIVQQNEVLSERLPEIAASTGVSDLAALTAAFGAAYSASGGDLEAAEAAVTGAAQLSSADPRAIRTKAAAALDLRRATGIDDVQQNLSLLLSAGAVARPDDPELFAKSFPRAVSQTIATMPEQNPQTLAIQAGALAATLTQFGGDVTGEETKTAQIQFANRLDALFDGKDIDPKDFAKRIAMVQADEGLRSELFSKNIGGEVFNGVFKQLGNGDSPIAKAFVENMQAVTMDTSVFADQARAARSVSPAASIANLKRSGDAAANIADGGQVGDAMMVQVRETVAQALNATRREGFIDSTADYFSEVVRPENLPGEFALSELQAAPLPLISQLEALKGQNRQRGGDPEIEAKIKALSSTIDTLEQTSSDYIDQIRSGRVTARPGEIEEAASFNRLRLNIASRPSAPNALGSDLGVDVLNRQSADLQRLGDGNADLQRLGDGNALQQTNELLAESVALLTDLKNSNQDTANNTKPRKNKPSNNQIIREARQ